MRLSLVTREIKEANPDIACIQELDYSEMQRMRKLAEEGQYEVFYQKKMQKDKIDGLAIFFKKSMFQEQQRYFINFNLVKG